MAKFLLDRGVDIHYQAPSCGSALHVAAARKHDEMVEVLLRYGADPFIANLKGSTALELAVLAGSESVVSKFHAKSLFSGEVEMQWKRFMSYEWKPRFVVIMERRACPLLYSSARDASAPVRRQMWIHSKRSSLVPKTRCWLEGSSAYLAGAAKSISVVRLHIAHAMPTGNCFTRFAEGYCFFTRPSTSKKGSDNAMAGWAHFNECLGLEGGADTVFSALGLSPLPLPSSIPIIPSLMPFLLEGGGRPAASGSAMPLGALPPPPLTTAAANNLRSSSMLKGSRSVAATPSGNNPLRMSMNAFPSGEELAAAALGGLTLDPNQPMPALSAASVSLPSTAFNSSQSTPMRGSYGGVVDGIAAKPGETDAQFASRLAEAVNVAALADSLGRADHHRGNASFSHNKAVSLPATPLRNSLAGAIPAVAVNSISSGGTVGATSAAQGSSGGGSGSRDMARSSSSGAMSHGGRHLPPKPPSKLPSFASVQSASKMSFKTDVSSVFVAPSAPPLEDVIADDYEIEAAEKDMCIICLSSPSQAGFLHGSDVHRCVCSSCSKIEHWVGKPCPVCRATIEKVLGVF